MEVRIGRLEEEEYFSVSDILSIIFLWSEWPGYNKCVKKVCRFRFFNIVKRLFEVELESISTAFFYKQKFTV